MDKYFIKVISLLLFMGIAANIRAQSVYDLLKSADLKAERNDFEAAILDYNDAASLFEARHDSSNDKGLASENLNEYLQITQVYFNRGLAKSKLKEYKAAIEDYGIVLKWKPSSPNAYFNRGQAYYYIADYVNALKDFNKYIELNPGSAAAFFSLAMVKIRLGDVTGGCSDLKKAVEMGYSVPADVLQLYCK